MTTRKPIVADAWDDDWETLANKPEQDSIPEVKSTKAERRAQHEEMNKKLWETAETTENFHFLESRNEPPLKTEFKPTVKVLSRKPIPAVLARKDPATGFSQLTLEDDDDVDDDISGKVTLSVEEQRMKSQKDREEKQRRYEEARARLFGTSETGSGTSTPGDVTPPKDNRRETPRGGRGKGRLVRESRGGTSGGGGEKQLFDPSSTEKPFTILTGNRRPAESPEANNGLAALADRKPIRSPRGPDGTTGFSSRGGKVT